MDQEPAKGFNGYFERLELVDVVQLACLEGHDRHLAVKFGQQTGSIFFADGEIVHARAEALEGQDAFFSIMCWPSGTFTLTFGRTATRSIDASWNFLLTEAMRRLDEMLHDSESGPQGPEVLVVDDSRLFTKAFVKLFENELAARIAGEATNGREALKFLSIKIPDLITLDINMPVMAGDQALKYIMIYSPAPVVLVSGFNEQSCAKMMEFMKLGAVDVVAKPKDPESWRLVSRRLGHILANVQEIRVKNVRRAKSCKQVSEKAPLGGPATKLLLILGGLGGILEVQKILPSLPADEAVAVVVVQDMYPMLVEPLASYLDKQCPGFTCRPLHERGELRGGQCLIDDCRGRWVIGRQTEGIAITNQDPDSEDLDIDSLVSSAAATFQDKLILLVLSGMDYDLAPCLAMVKQHGGTILLQEPDTCLLPAPLEKLDMIEIAAVRVAPEQVAERLRELRFLAA